MHQTPLYDFHRQQGAKLVEFAGWQMPLYYTSILEEHHWTREHATCFDVSHMGRIDFHGPDAESFLDRLCTRKLTEMPVGLCRYGHLCREDGGILDDVIVSKFEDRFLMVCNASNREKLLGWFAQQKGGADVRWEDKTFDTAMVAIQGPEALETMDRLLPIEVTDLKRYHFKTGHFMGIQFFVARSGYTGEDGVEIILPRQMAGPAAELLLNKSGEIQRLIRPAGLGARDTLRTEAAMPLYGHELTEQWDSITAGQAWCVALDKDFIGRDVCARVKEQGPARVLVGLEVDSKRTPRQGAPIVVNGETCGEVTSGVTSPTLGKVIAMGFVPPAASEPGTTVAIDLKGAELPATVVKLPFYKKK